MAILPAALQCKKQGSFREIDLTAVNNQMANGIVIATVMRQSQQVTDIVDRVAQVFVYMV